MKTAITTLKNARTRAMNCLLMLFVGMQMSLAQAEVDLSNFRGTSGAGSRKLDDQAEGWITSMNTGVKVFLAACTLMGMIIFVFALKAMNKAKREERDVPPSATWGMGVGAAMTCIPLILGFLANTLASE